jgi:hypothetical protein
MLGFHYKKNYVAMLKNFDQKKLYFAKQVRHLSKQNIKDAVDVDCS